MIQLTKNGIVAKDGDDENIDVVDRHGIFMALGDAVELAEDVSLRDIFRIFEPIKDFISAYSTIDYEVYAAELTKPVDWAKRESCPIDHIEITHGASAFERFKQINMGVDSHGVDSSVSLESHGKWDEATGVSTSRYWAIDAQPMNNIADLPIKLNKVFNIEKTEDGSLILEGHTKEFTLLEAIHALFYEISFFGLPSDRDAFLDMLTDRVEQVKNMTEEERATKLIPLEDILRAMGESEGEEDGNV